MATELFFRISNRRIIVKPMKGTAPRGLTLADDRVLATGLQNSEKNRAENVMIVDLMRNDIGRICRTGTVTVSKLFEVERLQSVWQMTSTVEGELREQTTFTDLLRALFPSGSVTGAPKIRAMEHIAELESHSRGVYTGAIGYIRRDCAQFNVAIRTVAVRESEASAGIGGGITYDSSASGEWEECLWKTKFLSPRNDDFQIIETLRWDSDYFLLNDHIARMADSAEYFGFAYEESRLRDKLGRLAETLRGVSPQRVQIRLARNGEFQLHHAAFSGGQFGRVHIASSRVSSSNPFLYHKTTKRAVLDDELASARAAQCDDALFFNEREELTEGAIHNVFVVRDGVWLTPPVSCGLLAGTFRAQILRSHQAKEQVLSLHDLKTAEAIYLCNSVRGAYRVELV